MDKIQELIKKPLFAAAIGFIIGLIIGLPVLGWGLMPVQWKDADPSYLRSDIKDDYFCMISESYTRSGDAMSAKSRLEGLGDVSETKLNSMLPGDCGLTSAEIDQFKAALGAVSVPLPVENGANTEDPEESEGNNSIILVGVLCLVTLLIGGALVYLFFFRNKKTGGTPMRSQFGGQSQPMDQTAVSMNYEEFGQEPPIAQFMSTYVTGDDLYDDSFSVDSPSGEFLGECGVGISETIGVGDPKKVTAFEVWLFDKNDIQTITKVLMSQYAFDDPAISQRLASKGEPVLIQPGGKVVLETATLQLEARVVDMNYGQGALPEGSFIDRVTLELAVWPKS